MNMQQLKPSREHDAPLYLQLYRRYRDAITAGKLHPGDRVPSVRSLASELNLARGTVEMAYQMLASEGYFMTRGPAGTIVSPRLENLGESGHIATSLSQIPTRPQTEAEQVQPFQLGLPALDAFPRKSWARLAGHNLRTLDTAAMIYPDPAGYEPLRRAIATYLGISRGITCTYEQVFITAGYRGALELVCRTLLQPGDSGWFEDPGYLFARQFLERAGMHLEPVPVDEEGLNVDMGQQRAAEARFAVVTPTHQSPMGVALSLPRRLQLLEWASHRRSWIIEDDYDSEFRYHGRPLPALKSLDRDGRVLYTGTFSKVLFPGLRLAYLVVPEPQIERFKDTANHFCCPGSILPQATVAAFMEQGHFARHLRRMRSLYAIRRGYLVDELLQTLGSHLIVQLQAGGIHVLAKLAARGNDQSLAAAAQSHGLAIQALNDWRMSRSSHGGLLMGFTNVTEPAMAKALVHRLAVAIGLS
ncbi:PLP-dependent aminotransferase family protein [Pectobacterium aroidearum]|uniref:PLP-dependent aminotransferase family protein n=1 Tax=Pectobacterium aroidearum TaxID=1201031 RepID=A0ABR5ZCB4_9GAMM|nr:MULTISPECIES: PLP-dependent aminotransferase family protein [Pectobacterium]MBA5199429.1 PLP-dependent aminotransferase family protein [Pectobacterium aroidearum]MBA5227866.1 PLP-dependent aminotransferase family protein [Pectobacterium aroidearum]MBA5232221.1 PLP-dependent aminotransferase family protein [Pectobacterium aroidearum]MBA5737385.1 PLP-dependent aminotransferase family protein [Pectobacterium aroidearum]UXJ99609.1 PLP-dependent aminotransferase family protein [Pectobacterium ar